MWKLANVLPLFKKGDVTELNNYRPVSLLPCVSKILERIVFKNLFNYIRDNKLISPHQSGFQPGDSTTNQLSYLYHVFAKALDTKKDVRVVFCDISKAFDRVWHQGLLFKLSSMGVGGGLLAFLKDYLSDRQQRVVIEGQASEKGCINAGVPQGSVLGPLLFLIYINDLTIGIRSNVKLFADDTSLFIEVEDPVESAETLNSDLDHIDNWAKKWLVNFSPSKTKLMTCSFKSVNHPDICFGGTILQGTATHKHLGLTLSSNLGWSPHVTNVLESASPLADVLKGLKYKVDKRTLEQIYLSFIRPKLEYACHIWDNCNQGDSVALENFQHNIARTVCGARKGTSHALINNELNWPTLAERRKGIKLKNFIRIVDGDVPQYLSDLLPARIGSVRPNSRNADNFYSIKSRTETFRNSFIPSTIRLWNSLQIQDRSLKYAQKLGNYVSNELYYFGDRILNVKHAQLRMKCSLLNYHLFSLHVIDSPECSCGYQQEDSNHYLLHCPLFNNDRVNLINSVSNLTNIAVTEKLLLYGSTQLNLDINKVLFQAVHDFIDMTGRL